MRWVGNVTCMAKVSNIYRMLVGKLEVKRSLGRPRRSWEDNIKIRLKDTEYEGVDGIQLWQAFVNTAINFRVP
jgi:hypothetical protein